MIKNRLLSALVAALFFSVPAGFAQKSWYKHLTGSIDKYPVTMHLHKMDHTFSGYYYYHSTQEPVYFTGEDTTVKGQIKLLVFPGYPDEEPEVFTFSITGNAARGEWKKNETGKALGFSARETKIPGRPAFEFVFTTGSSKLKPDLAESPEAHYEAASVWPTGNSPVSLFLKKLIHESFGEKNSTLDIGKIFLRKKKLFFEDYQSEFKDVKKEDIVEHSYSYNQDETGKLMIAYQSSKLLVLAHSVYSYSGGAHGNYGTSYRAIDLINKKKLTVADVLNESGQERLSPLLEKCFRKNYDLKDTDPLTEGGLFQDGIGPNDNFYITAKGIGFCYTPYEIGPYAMGEINLFIPFTELNAYLKPAFKKLTIP